MEGVLEKSEWVPIGGGSGDEDGPESDAVVVDGHSGALLREAYAAERRGSVSALMKGGRLEREPLISEIGRAHV